MYYFIAHLVHVEVSFPDNQISVVKYHDLVSQVAFIGFNTI